MTDVTWIAHVVTRSASSCRARFVGIPDWREGNGARLGWRTVTGSVSGGPLYVIITKFRVGWTHGPTPKTCRQDHSGAADHAGAERLAATAAWAERQGLLTIAASCTSFSPRTVPNDDRPAHHHPARRDPCRRHAFGPAGPDRRRRRSCRAPIRGVFYGEIRNPNTRRAYGRAVAEFLTWCEQRHVPSVAAIQPVHVAAWIEAQTKTHAAPPNQTITGHIDFLQVRNGAVHILDYKPDARTNRPFAQLTIYALALTRLAGLRLFDIKCAWFNEDQYCEFFPRTVLARKGSIALKRVHEPLVIWLVSQQIAGRTPRHRC